MNKNQLDYIKSMGLGHLLWFDYPKVEPSDIDDKIDNGNDHCFLLKYCKIDEQFCVTIGTMFADNFMEHDDLSWAGPVRKVVAFAPFKSESSINKGRS